MVVQGLYFIEKNFIPWPIDPHNTVCTVFWGREFICLFRAAHHHNPLVSALWLRDVNRGGFNENRPRIALARQPARTWYTHTKLGNWQPRNSLNPPRGIALPEFNTWTSVRRRFQYPLSKRGKLFEYVKRDKTGFYRRGKYKEWKFFGLQKISTAS